MKNTLPRWSIAALLIGGAAIAQSGSHVAGQGKPASNSAADLALVSSGDRLLVQALNQLERRRSITARLNYQVWLGGERLSGRGGYWQQGNGEDLRVRLDLQMIGQDSSLRQVSNGRALWIDQRLPMGRTVTQINLRELRADPVLAAESFEQIGPGQASWSPTRPDVLACSGGLPRLLASLSENFSFLPRQAMRLVSPGSPPQASAPYFAVVGHWKPERLAMLAGQGLATEGSSPGRFPQEVLLLFGQADLFPYRVEYRRRETQPPEGPNLPAAAYQLSAKPVVVLEFSDVAFDVPIAVGQFDYAPGDIDWVDQTAAVLERLHRERQAKIAKRPVEVPQAAPAR
ncbi:MAG TPA: hypothetical protein VHK01_18335 [Lacipirellulaceae bacterium]|nr:hypothetical protein [Lacipirellulaceae bacterium]